MDYRIQTRGERTAMKVGVDPSNCELQPGYHETYGDAMIDRCDQLKE